MAPSARTNPRAVAMPACFAAAGIAAAILLLGFPPAQYSFYPRCPIHELTGLLCPGCGATRALAALLHGNLGEGLHQNALILLLLPVALYYLLRAELPTLRDRGDRGLWVAIAAATVVFTLARNLP